jgi:transcriptional regulator with XRE-family HTH domain
MATEFGRYLKRVRTEVYGDTLREFSKRTGFSPSYLNKLEVGESAQPRRDTVQQIADRLTMDATPFLLAAGFTPPTTTTRRAADEELLLLLSTLDDEQLAAARTMIQAIRDADIRQRPLRPVSS